MTGTQAAEKEAPGSRADKLHRGRNVVLAFTMQVTHFSFCLKLRHSCKMHCVLCTESGRGGTK